MSGCTSGCHRPHRFWGNNTVVWFIVYIYIYYAILWNTAVSQRKLSQEPTNIEKTTRFRWFRSTCFCALRDLYPLNMRKPSNSPQKSEKKPEKMHSTTEKVVFQTHLQDPWVLTYQPRVIGSHRRCFLGDSWFPDVKSGGRKHLLTREIGLESAGASDQHHVPEYGGRHLASRFQGFFPSDGSCLPGRSQSTWGSQEETGQKKSKCLSGDDWEQPIDAGKRCCKILVKGWITKKKHVSWVSCFLQMHVIEDHVETWMNYKRDDVRFPMAEMCWNIIAI